MGAFGSHLRGLGAVAAAAVVMGSHRNLPRRPTPTSTSVSVQFLNVPASARPLLLYSGERSDGCRKYEPHVGSRSPTITLTGLSYDPACGLEVDVFAPGFGAYGLRLRSSSADTAWVETAVEHGTVKISLPAMTKLPTTVWIVATGASDIALARTMYERHLESAQPILEDLGAGVKLRPFPKEIAPGALAPDCDASDVIRTTPGIYKTATLNVYYVQNYLNVEFSSYAIDCWIQGHPEIIFVSWGNENNPDVALAHEVGHALGLIHPKVGGVVGGHTNDVPGFDDFNLMISGAPSVTNISIGQLYAMNFGRVSWFNRVGSSSPKPVTRNCQDSWGTGPCPRLPFFLLGWPVP